MQNKTPHNKNKQPHGLWEIYKNGKLYLKGNHINGKRYGRWERYWDDGSYFITYMIDDIPKGCLKADWSGVGNIEYAYIAT